LKSRFRIMQVFVNAAPSAAVRCFDPTIRPESARSAAGPASERAISAASLSHEPIAHPSASVSRSLAAVTMLSGRSRYERVVAKSVKLSRIGSIVRRMMSLRRFIVRTVLPGVLLASAGIALAQNYPARPVRIVTGAPGSGAEFAARVLAQGLAAPLGQPVVVEPRATGGATVFGKSSRALSRTDTR
jgi:hypothetical protein